MPANPLKINRNHFRKSVASVVTECFLKLEVVYTTVQVCLRGQLPKNGIHLNVQACSHLTRQVG